jgi:hypothetical protein
LGGSYQGCSEALGTAPRAGGGEGEGDGAADGGAERAQGAGDLREMPAGIPSEPAGSHEAQCLAASVAEAVQPNLPLWLHMRGAWATEPILDAYTRTIESLNPESYDDR